MTTYKHVQVNVTEHFKLIYICNHLSFPCSAFHLMDMLALASQLLNFLVENR